MEQPTSSSDDLEQRRKRALATYGSGRTVDAEAELRDICDEYMRRGISAQSDKAQFLQYMSALSDRATLLGSMKRTAEAIATAKHTVTLAKEAGNDYVHLRLHREVALGTLLLMAGDLDGVEDLFIDNALPRLRDILGEEHPQTLIAERTTGQCMMMRGRLQDAEKLFASALGGQRTTLGRNHPSTIMTELDLARLLTAVGRCDEAVALMRTRAQVLADKTSAAPLSDTDRASYRLQMLSQLAISLATAGVNEHEQQTALGSLRDTKLYDSTAAAMKRAPSEALQACVACQKKDVQLKRCGVCYLVLYCSQDCQRTDRERHRPYCKAKEK